MMYYQFQTSLCAIKMNLPSLPPATEENYKISNNPTLPGFVIISSLLPPKKLKKELGCGASIEGDDLILLGDLSERAKERLEAGGFQHVILCN